MAVLITGGAGYIGAAIAHTIADTGAAVITIDDHSTGTNIAPTTATAYTADIADNDALDLIFTTHQVDTIIHCAAQISVPDSLRDPLSYYESNVGKSIALLRAAQRHNICRIVFSSSAAVYGDAPGLVMETTPLTPQTPYARSKAMLEDVLHDAAVAGAFRVISLRYFNPIGADPLMRFGRAQNAPRNALQHLLDAARTKTPFVIAGGDWMTRDGTPLRDFIDIIDLARAHQHAIEHFDDITTAAQPFVAFNIGTGTGTTIGELATATSAALHTKVHTVIGERRAGDVVGAAASTRSAQHALHWVATQPLTDSVRRAWEWDQHQLVTSHIREKTS